MHLCSYNSHFAASLNKRTYIAAICLGRKNLWCFLLPWVVTILMFCSRSFCSTQKDDPAKQTNPAVPQIVDKTNMSFYLHRVEGTKTVFCWQCHKARSNTLICCLQTPSLLLPPGLCREPAEPGCHRARHEGGQDLAERAQLKVVAVVTIYRASQSLVCLSMLTSFRWDSQINSHWHHCLLITAPINHNCPLWSPLSSQNYASKCQASLYRST